MKIIGGAIGKDIHIAGILNFFAMVKSLGWDTCYLGPANSISTLISNIKKINPDIIAISYRLSPETAEELLLQLKAAIEKAGFTNKKYIFGGTPSTAEIAEKTGIFDKIFTGGESKEEIIKYLTGKDLKTTRKFPDNLIDRIKWKRPILRHHFGLPSLEQTISGAKEIAEAGILDVISIGPDQDAQEYFFHPELQISERKGDGGVPIRTPEDLKRIYKASRCGNYPLVRCYSGTNDLIKMAEMYIETINNAWCAVPLMWYNVLDKRSKRLLKDSITENQKLMKWHAERGIPVEVNESHHWSLRRAPDVIAVAMAYIAACNARQMGVKNYVSQYMFNTPGETSPKMDLAKMLAKIELIEALHDDNFKSFRQVRSGLLSFPPDLDMARGQLVSSIYLAMNLDPDIVHVVGYCEGSYIAKPKDIIESCKMVQQIIRNYKMGVPDMSLDPDVQARKDKLKEEAFLLIDVIKSLEISKDPLTDPIILCKAVEIGLLDAPDLKGNKYAKGEVCTKMINGACYAINPKTKEPIYEKERVNCIKEVVIGNE
ncbi:MAG: methionine synthase [Armatimonadetes bacterium]|nr:methionine synthase [Armatimonadota bacterium]